MRDYYNYQTLQKAMKSVWWQPTEIISGCCTGCDKLGERWALENNIPIKKFPADWQKYGKRAGMIRNRQMAEYGEALVAIWNGKSRGTGNMIKTARELGLKVVVQLVNENKEQNLV